MHGQVLLLVARFQVEAVLRDQPEQAEAAGVAGLGVFAGWLSIVMTAYGVWYVVKKSRTIIV